MRAHSVLDAFFLKRGQTYNALKPCSVIFICQFDLFGLGEPIYRFETIDEKNHLPLGDEQYTLILNADCSLEDCPEHLRTFYAYLQDGTVEESDELIREIHRRVEHANQVEGVQELMTIQEEIELRERRLAEAKAMLAETEEKMRQAEAQVKDAEAVNQLTALLLKDRRVNELERSMEDEKLREELMKEYKLR